VVLQDHAGTLAGEQGPEADADRRWNADRGTTGGQGPGNRNPSGHGNAPKGDPHHADRKERSLRQAGNAFGHAGRCGERRFGAASRAVLEARQVASVTDREPHESHRGRSLPARTPTMQTRKTG
jgi:hypothetical protein